MMDTSIFEVDKTKLKLDCNEFVFIIGIWGKKYSY